MPTQSTPSAETTNGVAMPVLSPASKVALMAFRLVALVVDFFGWRK